MKLFIALLWSTSFFAVGIILHVLGSLNTPSFSLVFAFSVGGGLAIANFDLVKRLKDFGMEFEAFQKEIDEVKDAAIKEIETEVGHQKKTIALLASCVTDLAKKLDDSLSKAEQISHTVSELENSLAQMQARDEQLQAKRSSLFETLKKQEARLDALLADMEVEDQKLK